MVLGLRAPPKDDFKAFLKLSVISHIIVLLSLGVKLVLFAPDNIVIEDAIRVDLVGLPDKIETPDPTPVTAKPEKSKSAPKEKTVVEKSVDARKKQSAALDKLKALSTLENLKQEAAEESERERLEELKKEAQAKQAQQFKGNTITSGNSLTGLVRLDYEEYYPKLKAFIMEHWQIPQYLAELNLKAQVKILMDESGYIRFRAIQVSSGNAMFDDFALSAVEKSNPLPAPPPRLRGVIAARGLILGFP